MKKVLVLLLVMAMGACAYAQTKIQLRSTDRAECVKSDMTSLKAAFSFSTIEAENVSTQKGEFSSLSLPNTVIGGNEGEPQIPVVNELIAVPVGAQPTITVTSYSSTDYKLNDLGVKTLIPRQPSLRKDKKPEEVPFVKNEAAYRSTRGFRSEPTATINVVGTMRGVQLGKMTIEPVSYDPVNNVLRVFNNIEVEVSFNGANAKATEDLLVETYSPYFDIVYKQLFNYRAVRSAYDDHPDLYTTPVKMLVVATQAYQSSTAFQNWLTWKKQKGIDVDIYTVTSSTASSTIQSNIKTRYNTNHPTFLVIVGDETVVPAYKTNWSCGSTYGNCINDLEYASMDGDVYHDMFMSRMAVSSTTELSNLVNKILTYEKYTMSDPSYLSKVLLIAGNDSGSWDDNVGRPTIKYALNNYYNTAHGFSNIYSYTTSSYTGCYNYLSSGVGFANYTAHGDINALSDPSFTVSNVSSLTNNDKYFWLVANCCLSANWGNSSISPCLGEALIRAENKGAFGYIGSIPESYWYEDYYFGVGAFSYVAQTVQTTSSTTTGMYDALFDDAAYNTLNSVPYLGNVAVTYAHAAGYTSSVEDEYYWRAYQCLGDGSVMPYNVAPAANNVSHDSSIIGGTNSFRVNADAGSYVSITVNNEIIGVAAVPSNATYVDVPFTTTPVAGTTAMIVVTRNQRQPYINAEVPVINNNAPQYTITANVTPSNSGTVEGAGTYYENTNCTLKAVANHGYAFQKWNDNNTDNPRTITVTGNATYTATFRQLQEHHITYTAQQTHGTISVSPTNAYVGDVVTLTATPATGYMLDHWTVTTDSKEEIPVVDNKFTMPDKEVTVSATFRLEPVDLTVYNGTATNQYIPMYGYYFDNYTKSECIIPASALTAMNGATISAITFYPSTVGSTNSTWTSTSQTVFLKEVSSTTLGGSFSGTSGATTVKQGLMEMPTAGEAYTITFDTPYTYNGGNLLIGIYNTAKGSYNKVEWYGTSGLTSGVSAYGNNSNSLSSVGYTAQAFLPKTSFTYTPTTDPYINLAPNSATVLTGFTQTLTATCGNVNGTPAITYSSSNTNVATVSGSSTTATVTAVAPGTATITATMTYEGTAYTATCAITVEDPSFCEPSFSSPSDDYISNFTTTGGTTNINNSSTYVTGGYSDYYSTQSASIDAGETLSCTVTSSSTQWSYGHAIWVDWNKDYEFSSDERVAYTTSTATGNWTGSFVVPEDADGGDYRMRVIHYYNNTPTDACMSAQYGEAEDYKLTVFAASSCARPTNLVAGTPDAHSVQLSWTAGGEETAWQICLNGDESHPIPAETNPYPLGSLTEETTYSVKVRAICGEDEYSGWSNEVNFTTAEACPTPTITGVTPGSRTAVVSTNSSASSFNLRYREYAELTPVTTTYDFEDGVQGWTILQGANSTSPNNWHHNTTHVSYDGSSGELQDWSTYGHNSSSGFMMSESYISSTESGVAAYGAVTPDNYLISPEAVRLGGSISFYAGARNTSYCAEVFSVMVSTTGNSSTSSFTEVATWTLTLSSAGYNSTPYTADLSAYAGQTGYIAIRHHDCNDEWVLLVDDITITEPAEDANDWIDLPGVSNLTITGLTPETKYEVQVQAICGGEDGTSNWSATATFTTTESTGVNQDIVLTEGWNWWAPMVEITLEDLERALGENGTTIMNQDGETASYSSNGWSGTLSTLEIGEMYMIQTNADITTYVEGEGIDPAMYPVTLVHGSNWVGFIGSASMTLDQAFVDLTPANMDVVKTKTGTSVYYEGRGWRGTVNSLTPGEGFIYNSKSQTEKNFVFPSNIGK